MFITTPFISAPVHSAEIMPFFCHGKPASAINPQGERVKMTRLAFTVSHFYSPHRPVARQYPYICWSLILAWKMQITE
jgi:hypothetical protein